jgi:ABC-2 type transport system permease protein
MKKIDAKGTNQLRALLTLTKYSFLANVRNPATVFFGIAFPLIFIMVFGLLGEGGQSYEIGVSENSVKTGPVYDALDKIDVIELETNKSDAQMQEELGKGQIPAVMTITEKQVNDQVVYDVDLQLTQAAPEDGQIIKSIVGDLLNQINTQTSGDQTKLAELELSEVSGRRYKAIDFILPGQLGFALFNTGIFGLAFTFFSLRERLIIKRIFASPVKKWVFISSEVLSRTIIAMFQATIIILTGVLAFDFTLAHGVWTLLTMLILAFLGLFMSFGIGLSISSIARDENTIPPLAQLVSLPQFLMAGTFFPIEVLPDWLQPIAKVMPLRYLSEAMRVVSFEGVGLDHVWKEILAILLWSVVIYAITIKVFKWE